MIQEPSTSRKRKLVFQMTVFMFMNPPHTKSALYFLYNVVYNNESKILQPSHLSHSVVLHETCFTGINVV